MTTPNRFEIIGNYKFVGKGKVLDKDTGKTFDAELKLIAETAGVETNPKDGTDVKVNLKLVKDEDSGTMWEMIILDNEEKNKTKISELTDDRYENHINNLIKTTKHSKQQIEAFFTHLDKRMNHLWITSLNDLFIRYESINKANYSERVKLLNDVAGFYHLNSLTALMGLLESEKQYKEMITYYNEKLEKQKEVQDGLEVYSKEYQDSLKKEMSFLKSKQHYIEQLSELLS